MDLLTSLIFIVLICIGLVVWLFILHSKSKNLSKDLEQVKQQNDSLTQDLNRAKQNEEIFKKRVVYLNCRLKAEEIKPKWQKLREASTRPRNGDMLWDWSKV